MDDIKVNNNVTIPGWELWFTASRSGGPGGQHANTTSSRVDLHWNLEGTSVLNDRLKNRVRRRLGSYINQDGVLTVSAGDERSQHRNRDIARERMAELVAKGIKKKKRRIPTKPSRAARRRRVKNKRHRGKIKKLRKSPKVPKDY